jgi:acyl carrier protein
MEDMSVFRSRLAGFIAQLAKQPESAVTDDVPLREIGVDSLGALEIVAWVELQLHTEVPEDTIRRIRTMGDILALVASENGASPNGKA